MKGLERAVEELDKVRRRVSRLRDMGRLSKDQAGDLVKDVISLRRKLIDLSPAEEEEEEEEKEVVGGKRL